MERHGGSPRGWAYCYLREKGLSNSGRVTHELRLITEVLQLAGTFDQLNFSSLSSTELIARRIQPTVEAHAISPQKPCYDNASLFAGQGSSVDGVCPELKSFVARKAREDAEIEKSKAKVWELKKGDKGAGRGKGGDTGG